MIWGGDDKVLSISKFPVKPDGLSIGFGSRMSASVISAKAYSNMSSTERDEVATKLFNDIYWFDQKGCGSPRVVFSLGEGGDNLFDLYERVEKVAVAKQYLVEAGTSLTKFSYMNDQVAFSKAKFGDWISNRLSILSSALSPTDLENAPGAGLLYHVKVDQVEEIAPFLNERTQTITHLGLDGDDAKALASLMASCGGYRLVPLGEALSFSDIWDGIDLMRHMTRELTVKL